MVVGGVSADWSAIAKLKETVTSVPVLGNGDIWTAADALRMMAETGCDGVVVGRGCLGRPWLFRDLAAAFAGEELATLPNLGEVKQMMRRHAELLTFHMGEERGCKEFRKHISWYTKGLVGSAHFRHHMNQLESVEEQLAAGQIDRGDPHRAPRKAGHGRPVSRRDLLRPSRVRMAAIYAVFFALAVVFGMLIRLIAYASLTGREISMELAQDVLRNVIDQRGVSIGAMEMSVWCLSLSFGRCVHSR